MSDESKVPDDQTEPRPESSADEPAETKGPADTPSTGEASTTQTLPTPAPPAPPPMPERRLVRRPEGKVIAGVCSGIAAFTGVDPVAVRIGFVIGALFSGGLVLLAYLICWLVMPMAPEGEPLPAAPRADWGNSTQWIAIGAILLGAFLLFRNIFDFRPGIFWGLLLVGVGVALWGRGFVFGGPPNGDRDPKVRPAAPTSVTGAAIGGGSSVAAPPPPPPLRTPTVSPASPTPPASRREPSILGRLVVGAAALAVGLSVLFDNLGAIRLSPKTIVVVLLLIVGAGLLIGTFWGRARWLIFPGIALASVLGLLSLTPNFPASAGERLWRPASLSELRQDYNLGAGELVLDLSRLDFGGHKRVVEPSVGFGEIIVIVPDNVGVVADAQVGAGQVDLFRRTSEGLGVNQHVRSRGQSGGGLLDVDARVGFGEVTVRRANDIADLRRSLERHHIEIGSFDRPHVPFGNVRIEPNRADR